MTVDNSDQLEITGSGGGGKKGGAGGKSADNTLRSFARARIVEAISEGPIVGLLKDDGAKSIYFDETPLRSDNDTYNFDNVTWQERKGYPDDVHINGHNAVESLNSVEVQVKTATGPVVRTITNPNADAVRIIIRVDSLFKIDDQGQAQVNTLQYKIELRSSGGAWFDVVNQNFVNEKASSPVQISHRVELPVGGHPWDIRVTKLTTDSNNDKDQKNMTFESFTNLVEGRFTYPHTALVALEVEAESLGQSVPERAYLVKGRIISVPNNYDPELRTYTGMWNGVFKEAWTNNPAWIFYDLLTNDRYGLGEHITDLEVSNLKWRLYSIAQYCDELVPSGFKDDSNQDIMEPRFTFNGVIRDRKEAHHVLQQITTSFRGMGYWALGQIFATADMPADPVKLVTPANVINGKFSYSSTAQKARHTVAMVRWNDPNDFFRTSTELVVNDSALSRYGWREKRVDMLGCTSRGLAHRYGKWLLDVAHSETETVEYKASFDHMDVAPGDIISIADPRKTSVRLGGRIKRHFNYSSSLDEIELDAETAFVSGESYQIHLTMKDGSIVTENVVWISEDQTSVRISNQSEFADTDSVFIITGTDVAPIQYRIISINESDENIFQITALHHDPTKYARIERGMQFHKANYSREASAGQVRNLSVDEISYVDNGIPRTKTRLSWGAPSGVIVREYVVQVTTPTEVRRFVTTTRNLNVDIHDLENGDHVFYVTTIDRMGRVSPVAQISNAVVGADAISDGVVSDLTVVDGDGDNEFKGRDVRISWKNLFPSKSGDEPDTETQAMYDFNTVRVYDDSTNTLLRESIVRGNSYTYSFEFNLRDCQASSLPIEASRNIRFDVSVTSKRGNSSLFARLVATNPRPAAITPNVRVSGVQVTIQLPRISDGDIQGMKIWVEDNGNFDPNTTEPKVSGPLGVYTFNGNISTEYFIKAGYYDSFDDTVEAVNVVSVTTANSELAQETWNEIVQQAENQADNILDNFKQTVFNPSINQIGIEFENTRINLIEPLNADLIRLNNSIDDIADNTTRAMTLISGTTSLVSDAGITIDPESGEVYIKAIRSQEDQLVDVSQRLSAAEGSIETRATLVQVNQAIASAQLNPTELAALDDIHVQINEVEQTLDAFNSSINTKASITIVDGIESRLSSAETEIDALEGEIVNRVRIADFNGVESRISSAESILSALDIPTFVASVSDFRRLSDDLDEIADSVTQNMIDEYNSEQDVRGDLASAKLELQADLSDTNEAISSMRSELISLIDGNSAVIASESQARISQIDGVVTAIGVLRDELRIDVGDNLAAINLETQARIDADNDINTSVTNISQSLQSQIDNNVSLINLETQARAGEDEALASSLQTLQTQVGDNLAAINLETQARASEDEALALSLQALQAQVGDNLAAITSEAQIRITEDETLASSIQNLQTQVGDNLAAINSEIQARVSADSSQVSSITNLEASLNGVNSSVTTIQGALTDLEGNINAAYVLRVQAGTSGSELELVAADDIGGNPASVARISADHILLNGSVRAEHLSVQTLSSVTANMGTVTAGVLKSSDNNFIIDLNNKTITITV